ncbi:hypothetical protein TCAL_13816 [Tigriopus californicus]|uniref:Apple domain-containing protein n=1 Tax=Tigriopus californicus TaxID=6832 RepID=A0A553PLC7_TIGCA|nr:uncharacterized protein LOC131890076 [Tigriopus californicus]TRY78494.1 hypothetical protein TCAL_13816 [Tigriopus californicus]|eukprot:TCALIF_13816-PA protein Name:"Protein of unknown function" AED:0.01 eAED:0.01 QI:0/1/0.66/1/1/1/3/83/425
MNGFLLIFPGLLILAKCLVINGCVVEDVRCVKSFNSPYETSRTRHHIRSGEDCLANCTKIFEKNSEINYFTYDSAIERCRCSRRCIVDREESAKGDVAGLISAQDPDELCVTEADVEEEADAFISIMGTDLVQPHPLSEDSYCNTKANRDAAKFPVSLSYENDRRAFFFNNDEVVACGGWIGCDGYNIHPEIQGHSTLGLSNSPVNISLVTFSNGTTWLLGGENRNSKSHEPLMNTYLYDSNSILVQSPVAMPQAMTMSCSARISDSQVFLVDGLTGDCFMFDSEQGSKWISLPGLLSPKMEEVLCAVAKNNGDPLVIVDGWMGDEGKDEPSQIFHVASQTWTFAPGQIDYVIPYRSAILPLGNSVISVGGFVIDNTGQRVKNTWIRMYDLKTGNWVVRGSELEDTIGGTVHLLVPKSLEMCKPR